jgi:hypothetical protein
LRLDLHVSVLGLVAVVLGSILAIALLVAAVVVPIRRRSRRIRAGIEDELGDDVQRLANARGLGLQSKGRGQVRGNGWLALTADELVFRQWVPARETRIALAAVTAVGTERTWLGKWVGSRLLCVRWRTPAGDEDAMAWQVADLDGWVAAVDVRRR